MRNVDVLLALGRVAFDTYVRYLREQGVETKGLRFYHAASYNLPETYPVLVASYHPSRQNTQTGKLTAAMFDTVFTEIRRLLERQSSNLV